MLRRMKRKPSRALSAPAASVSPGFKILRFLLRPFGYEIQPRQLAPELRKRAVGGAGRMDKVMAGALRTWLNTHPKARLVFRHVRRLENLLRCGQSGAIDLDLITGCADELCRAGLERTWSWNTSTTARLCSGGSPGRRTSIVSTRFSRRR